MAPTNICTNCRKKIQNKEFLKCAVCTNIYHIACTGNVSEKRFYLMDKDKRHLWKCAKCINKGPKPKPSSPLRNINVVVGSKSSQKEDIINPITPSSGTNSYDTHTNAAASNLMPTTSAHLFSSPIEVSLAPEASTYETEVCINMNTRRGRRFRSLSAERLDLDDSKLSESSSSAYSLPDISIRAGDLKLQELEDIVKELQERLESADTEIERLIQENFSLKKKLVESEKKTKHLKTMFQSPTSSSKKKKHKTDNTQSKVLEQMLTNTINIMDNTEAKTNEKCSNLFSTYEPSSLRPEPPSRPPPSESLPLPEPSPPPGLSLPPGPSPPMGPSPPTGPSLPPGPSPSSGPSLLPGSAPPLLSSPQVQKVDNIKKIHIVGTQQCVGLASMMIRLRENTKYEKYQVTALTKPYASSDEILHVCDNINLNEKDNLVLCIGENDSNPMKIISNLCVIMKKFSRNNILLLNVVENIYLNERKLSEQLKLVSKNHTNSHFINICTKSLFDACRQINSVIDFIDYKDKYLSFNKRRNVPNKYTNIKHSHQNKTKRQTTLLDYFNVTHLKKKCNSNLLNISKKVNTISNINSHIDNDLFRK